MGRTNKKRLMAKVGHCLQPHCKGLGSKEAVSDLREASGISHVALSSTEVEA